MSKKEIFTEDEIEVDSIAIKFLNKDIPITERELSFSYHALLEKWVEIASMENILKFLIKLHNLYYPEIDDIDELNCGDWENGHFSQCNDCSDFMLAIMTIQLVKRPDLKDFKKNGINKLKNNKTN